MLNHACPKALPCTLGVIKANPTLKEDHCRGVILATFPLTYTAFDNSIAAGNTSRFYRKGAAITPKRKIIQIFSAGPVPTMFSQKPDKTLAVLKKSPEYAFRCLQALVSKLLTRGELTR